jgi:hypothetical protein
MKSCYPEDAWALYVEDDVSGSQTERMHAHLLDCPQCRDIVNELHESQLVIKSLRPESAPATAHAIVRERVLDEVLRQQSTGWTWRLERMLFGIRWRYAVCGVALIAFSAALLWQSKPSNEARNVTVSALPVSPSSPSAIEKRIASEPDSGTREIRRARRPAKPIERREPPAREAATEPDAPPNIAETPRPAMVKLLTDDPNVVIYWIVDQKGGSNDSIF